MDTEERILNDPQCAPYVDQQRKWINEAFMAGVNWAQQNGTIPWQTGDPKEEGDYLVVVHGKRVEFDRLHAYDDIKNGRIEKAYSWKKNFASNITAWCHINKIKPYKK